MGFIFFFKVLSSFIRPEVVQRVSGIEDLYKFFEVWDFYKISKLASSADERPLMPWSQNILFTLNAIFFIVYTLESFAVLLIKELGFSSRLNVIIAFYKTGLTPLLTCLTFWLLVEPSLWSKCMTKERTLFLDAWGGKWCVLLSGKVCFFRRDQIISKHHFLATLLQPLILKWRILQNFSCHRSKRWLVVTQDERLLSVNRTFYCGKLVIFIPQFYQTVWLSRE